MHYKQTYTIMRLHEVSHGLSLDIDAIFLKRSLMPSTFTGDIIEGQIALLTSPLGLLVKKLIMGMSIRFSVIPENWKS